MFIPVYKVGQGCNGINSKKLVDSKTSLQYCRFNPTIVFSGVSTPTTTNNIKLALPGRQGPSNVIHTRIIQQPKLRKFGMLALQNRIFMTRMQADRARYHLEKQAFSRDSGTRLHIINFQNAVYNYFPATYNSRR